MALNLRVTLAYLCLYFLLHPTIGEIEDSDGKSLSKFIRHFEPLNYDTTPLDVQQNTKQRGQSSHDTINWEVFAFGRSFPLQLSPYPNIISQDAQLNVVNSEGITSSDLVSHMYKGIIIGDKHSSVHGHITNGTFDGVIKTNGETFHIEPSFRYFGSRQPGFHSVIYHTRDIHLQEHPNINNSTSCQLCSVSWDSSKLASSEKYSLVRHNFLKDQDDSSSSSSGQRNRNSSKRPKPIAPSNSEAYLDIFQTMQSLSNSNQPITSQGGSIDQDRSRPSQDAELPDESFNTSRREHLTDYDLTSKTCVLHIVVDHTFFQHVAGLDVTRAVAEVAYHIEEANSIYRATDFDGDGIADNIGLAIGGVTIFESATAQNYLLSGDYPDAEEFLSEFSLYNFSAYCMGLGFTYRDFAGGILGLAWMGYPDIREPPGGICQRQLTYRNDGLPSSLNTAMITLVNYGTYVPRSISMVSVMHELGHGFGSLHDPPTPSCSTSGPQGNYIMYSQATDGNKPNNDRFSSCSRSQMAKMIASKGNLCLQSHAGQYCGNGLVENGEECDCGTASLCALGDGCCTPKGGVGSDLECTMRRELGRVCSPLTSMCCDDDCHVIPSSWHKHCFTDNECLRESYCNGSSADCPEPEPVPDGFMCDGGTKRCLRGQCILSACYDLGYQECLCADVNNTGQSCQLCCQISDGCIPAAMLGLTTHNGDIIRKHPGSACGNYTGYCNLQAFCVTIDTDSALDKLKNVLTKEGTVTLFYWMRINWYYVVCGVLCICFLFLSVKLSYDNWHYMQTMLRTVCHFTFNMDHTRTDSQTGAEAIQSVSVLPPAATGNTTSEPDILTVESPRIASSSSLSATQV